MVIERITILLLRIISKKFHAHSDYEAVDRKQQINIVRTKASPLENRQKLCYYDCALSNITVLSSLLVNLQLRLEYVVLINLVMYFLTFLLLKDNTLRTRKSVLFIVPILFAYASHHRRDYCSPNYHHHGYKISFGHILE